MKENIKDKAEDFVKLFNELPEAEKPNGNTAEEKVNNFVANQKSEVVIKTVFKFKLQDEVYQKEIESEMESKKNDKKEVLDESVYKKKDGKYTKEAMAQYLFEQETGKGHQFAAKEQQKGGDNTSTGDKGHWDN